MEAVSTRPPRWNHNLHYHRVILAAVPDGARRSLDVGCGVGMLARDLRRVVPHVKGIDRDAASIDVARREDDGAGVEYIVGDFMTHPFEPGSFDHIASIAALHHMDAGAALERMRELLAPGGCCGAIRWCGRSRRELVSARRLAVLRGAYCRIEGRRVAVAGAQAAAPAWAVPAGGPRSSCALGARFATPSAGACGRTSVFPPLEWVGPTFDARGSQSCCETRAIAPPKRTRLRTTTRATNRPPAPFPSMMLFARPPAGA